MPFDFTTPINIQAINNTAREIQPKITRLMMSSIRETFANFVKYPGDIRKSVDLVTFKQGSIMKPYDPNLGNSKSLGVISKRTLGVEIGMSFVKDEVERYRDTYLDALDTLELSNQAKLPFENWYLETITMVGLNDLYILPYQGILNASGTNPQDICTGYLKHIADGKTSGDIATGNNNLYTLSGSATDYTSSTIGDELKAQFAKFPQKTQEFGVDIHIPYRYKSMYKEWYKSEYTNVTDGDVPTDYLDGTDKKGKFIWTSAMGSTKTVFMVTSTNLVYGVDKSNQEFGRIIVFFFENNPYIVAATNKCAIGFQIRTLDYSEFNCNNLV